MRHSGMARLRQCDPDGSWMLSRPMGARVAAVLTLTEERPVMTADDLDCSLAFVNYSIASARDVIQASTDQIVVERFQAAIQAAAGKWVSRDHITARCFSGTSSARRWTRPG